MEGGIETGFKHVPVEKYRSRLLQVKGRKNFRVFEVEMRASSLCSNDVFILDDGLTIYNWVGSKSNPFEKFKASSVCNTLKEERKSVPKVVMLEEGKESEEFWKLLGGKAEVNVRKEDAEKLFEKVLYRLSDSGGSLEMKLMAKGIDAKIEMLDSNDVFIFDIGTEVFVWVGKGASENEKKFSLQNAQNYINSHNRPANLSICSLKEGHETDAFVNGFKI